MVGRRSRRSISTSRRAPGSIRTTGEPSCRPRTGGNISGPPGSRFAGAGGGRGVRLRPGQDTVAVAGRANSAPARLSLPLRPHRHRSQRVKRQLVWLKRAPRPKPKAVRGPLRPAGEGGGRAGGRCPHPRGRTASSSLCAPTEPARRPADRGTDGHAPRPWSACARTGWVVSAGGLSTGPGSLKRPYVSVCSAVAEERASVTGSGMFRWTAPRLGHSFVWHMPHGWRRRRHGVAERGVRVVS